MLKLLAASALLSGRDAANPSDLWVLRYVWDRVEQIDPLAALVNGVLDRHRDEPDAHPLAAVPEAVDAEDLARQLETAERQLESGPPSLAELARLREHVGSVADRAAWVGDDFGPQAPARPRGQAPGEGRGVIGEDPTIRLGFNST